MRVVRFLSFALVGLAVQAAAGGAAAAESCSPAAIIEAWRQGEAAYQAKNFDAATAQLRPLAEQGLGPAALRLGEMLASGDKPDLIEAYKWVALAADAHTPGAAAALAKLSERIGPSQLALNRFTPATWRPTAPWACLAGDPHVKKPDGTPDYDFERVINRRPSATPTTQQAHRDWLAISLDAIRSKPRYLVYLKALDGIGFVDGAGPIAVPSERGKLPFVLLNQGQMEKVSAKDPAPVLTAVTTAVHAALMPGAFTDARSIATVSETYKGVTIRSVGTDAGSGFIRFARSAIDLTDQLPPDLQKLARSVAEIRYEPSLGEARARTVTFGTFKRDPKTGQGYMSFAENVGGRAPAWMVVALAGGGIYQRRGGAPKPADPSQGDCEIDMVEIRVREALQLSPSETERAKTASSRRGCAVPRS